MGILTVPLLFLAGSREQLTLRREGLISVGPDGGLKNATERLAAACPWARVLVAAASPFRRLLLGGLRLAERCMKLALR